MRLVEPHLLYRQNYTRWDMYIVFFLHLSPGQPAGSMSPAILVVAATIPSVFAAVLFVIVLFCVTTAQEGDYTTSETKWQPEIMII